MRRLTNNPGIDIADLVALGHADRVHLRPHRHAADLHDRRRRPGPAAAHVANRTRDRPTWSPAPFNEIAYAARTGPGFDIKVIDLATGQVRQLTFGEGTNESPAWAPNGRHIAFTSTRARQGADLHDGRDGKDLKQITQDRQQLTARLVQLRVRREIGVTNVD